MFNFIKKGIEKDEKEKRKKEKDGKKKRERTNMTADELLRLDEMRRSLKIRGRRKEKEKLPSGITADYSENFFADLEQNPDFKKSNSLPGHTLSKCSPKHKRGETSTQSDSSEASSNSLISQRVLPPLPPRPPKRGILKGTKANVISTDHYENQDPNLLVRNTLQNEVIISQNNLQINNIWSVNRNVEHNSASHSQPDINYLSKVNDKNNLSITSTSPSAESLTDTTNSSFATPPFSLSPVGENESFSKIYSNLDEKNISIPLPDIIPFKLPPARELTIHRTARGDFGFQLRRAIVTDKLSKSSKKTVVFAEPGIILNQKNETGLLPGDVLLEVNGTEVHDKSREDIIDLIKSSNTSVTVKVQPIPELCELMRRSGLDGKEIVLDENNIRAGTLRRSGSLRFKKATAKSDEELANERACLENEKLWLVHKNGFSAVRALSDTSKQSSDIGKVKIRLENSEQILEVDEDDLEKANPIQFDHIEDLCQLRYINESSILHLLRQRYGNNLIHTYAAGNLIVINPQCTLTIYNDKVADLFRGCKSEDMPPHIYALSQSSYRSMLSTRKDQSIVLVGRSGSGKTYNFRHILSYLLHCSGSLNKVLTVERLNALNTILEAFGNARTCLNISATRCTNLVNLDFDQTGQITSLSLQMLMLEKQRIARRPEGEATFNIFHWLLSGAESSLAKRLFLDSTVSRYNPFVTYCSKDEDRQRAIVEFSKLSLAFKALGISEKECFVIWSVISVIYHLGHAGAVQVGTNKWQFADPVHSTKACRLLGTTSEELSQAIWDSPGSPTKNQNTVDKVASGMEALEGFVIGLYSEVVKVVNGLINRCLTSNVHSTMSIVIVDSPGFQNPGSCIQNGEATFSDLCHNYVQERIHLMFHNVSFVAPRDRYTQEHIDLNADEVYVEMNSPNQTISILDKSPPSGVLKTSQTDLREIDRRGLLWLLDEESIYPNSTDETFLERLFQHYGYKDYHMFIRKTNTPDSFIIQHFQGTNPVTYCAKGWLKASKENPLNRVAINFLHESAKEEIRELFVSGKGLQLSVSEGSQSLRRVSSIRRTCSTAVKRKSIGLQIKFTTDGLIETLRRTRPRFVFCMLAQHNGGMWDHTPGTAVNESIINVPLLRSQVRGAEILPATRIYKQGFPEFLPHGEFKRRFRLLASISSENAEHRVSEIPIITVSGQQSPSSGKIDEAHEVEEMLMTMDVDMMSYRIGLTQKLQKLTMPTLKSLNFGQKNGKEETEIEEINASGLLNQRIVVERVKNAFGMTLKSKENSKTEDLDFRRVIKLFHTHGMRKSVTFAKQNEVITMENEVSSDYKINSPFCGNKLLNKNEGEDEKVKNLLFHEVDENFNPELNRGLWKSKSSFTIGKEAVNPPRNPPPLPPKPNHKSNGKMHPSIPPPLPPKAVNGLNDSRLPIVQRNLKISMNTSRQNVSELVNSFIRLQENVLAEKPYESSIPITKHSSISDQPLEENGKTGNAFVFDKCGSMIFFDKVRNTLDTPNLTTSSLTTFKPEVSSRPDWKEEFFQPLNKSSISSSKVFLQSEESKISPVKIIHHSKSSKVPKIVGEIMEKATEKKFENYASATIKNCKVNVSSLVNNFERIRKDSEKDKIKCTEKIEKSIFPNRREKNFETNFKTKLLKSTKLEMKQTLKESLGSYTVKHKDTLDNKTEVSDFGVKNRALCLPLPFDSRPITHSLRSFTEGISFSEDDNVGTTEKKVFFRAGTLAHLESLRDEKLCDLIIQFQSRCRGYIARKKLCKLKVQDLAVRCIQKNVRKLMRVREWPWWRLYVKVAPLLNVHRTEEELSARLRELEALKSKVEKLESERNQLRLENYRLETKLKDLNVDLSEERASGTLQAERLEAERAERVRLEQELSQIQEEKKNLLQTSEKLEMELFYARADVNGLSEGEGDLEEGGGDAAMYKQKCERAVRELEFTRRRLQQQHEDDLEQLVALKKQLEKKLADAYEEVEEQRQIVGQWKRKVQKFQSEMNDMRLLLEEQNSRNNLLEKKQRKFDSEIQLLQEELRSEKNQKDRLSREKEMAYAEKYSTEQNLSSVRLELELKEEKLSVLTKEVDELTRGGGSEQEVTQLRKTKHDLELKLKEQEEELDELAGQVSMLESTKLRLEMSLESLRKELRREMSQREDELDEVRSNSQKKLKALEAQLENEHEERTLLLREKHELERRLNDAEERARHHKAADEDVMLRLRRDLKKTKALLRDAHIMLERTKQDSPSKATLRTLKNQLDDAEHDRACAVKAKQSLESELCDLSGQLEEAIRIKGDAESKFQAAQRECNALRTQVDENEEELAELLKKYRQIVQQLSAEQLVNQETTRALVEAESERASLKDQLAELTAKLEANALLTPVSGMAQKRLEIRSKELESRLELEQTTRSRLEVQITRLKENVERLTEECIQAKNKEQTANEATRKYQRSLREAKEEMAQYQAKEQEAAHKKKELEKRLETAEQEATSARTDLRLALKRIEDLQIAMSGEIESDSDGSDSEAEEESADESLMIHLQNSLTCSRGNKTSDSSHTSVFQRSNEEH